MVCASTVHLSVQLVLYFTSQVEEAFAHSSPEGKVGKNPVRLEIELTSPGTRTTKIN